MTRPVQFVRAPIVRAFDVGARTVVVASDDTVHELADGSAMLVRAILDALITPRDRDELVAHLAELDAVSVTPPEGVDQALALLRRAGAVITTTEVEPPAPKLHAGKKVLLGISGAVSASESPHVIMGLHGYGFDVRVALTTSAQKFVAPRVLEALTHHTACTGFWDRDPEMIAPHIQLAKWPDIMLVCPASATTLGRIAQGDCSDVVWAAAIATRAPVILVPAMNALMASAPSIRRNLEQLRDDGFHILHPAFGLELATPPADRAPRFGAPMPPEYVASMVSALMSLSPEPRA